MTWKRFNLLLNIFEVSLIFTIENQLKLSIWFYLHNQNILGFQNGTSLVFKNTLNLVGFFYIQRGPDSLKKSMKLQLSLLVRNKYNLWDNILYLGQKAFMNLPQGTWPTVFPYYIPSTSMSAFQWGLMYICIQFEEFECKSNVWLYFLCGKRFWRINSALAQGKPIYYHSGLLKNWFIRHSNWSWRVKSIFKSTFPRKGTVLTCFLAEIHGGPLYSDNPFAAIFTKMILGWNHRKNDDWAGCWRICIWKFKSPSSANKKATNRETCVLETIHFYSYLVYDHNGANFKDMSVLCYLFVYW